MKINFPLHCNSSNFIYVLECVVWVFNVGSTSTLCMLRFNHYKASYCRFRLGSSDAQMELFKYISKEEYRGFFDNISVKIIDRLSRKDRIINNLVSTLGGVEPALATFGITQPIHCAKPVRGRPLLRSRLQITIG